MSQYVRTKDGVPTLEDFRSSEGTPLVLDVTTNIVYYLLDNVVTPVQVDPVPRYGWRDLEGPINVPSAGANRPTLRVYTGDIEDYSFATNDHYGPLKFHIPHDHVPGSDVFIHTHWSHTGTNITGTLQLAYNFVYAKGHSQESFPATQKTLVQTITGITIANAPNRMHRIDEVQFSTPGGGATQLDTDLIEPDGMILMHFDTPVVPAVTGGFLFIHYIDFHYQSTNGATPNKSPPFL